jgi:hypothetical protein
VGTGFPQKMRQNQKPRSLSDSIESESDLALPAENDELCVVIAGTN